MNVELTNHESLITNTPITKEVLMKKFLIFFAVSFLSAYKYNCVLCHNCGIAIKLDTMSPEEIIKKTKEYKNGKGNPMMVRAVEDLSDEEIKKAAYELGKK